MRPPRPRLSPSSSFMATAIRYMGPHRLPSHTSKLGTGSLLLSIVGTADYQASHPKPGSTVTVEPACTNSSLAVSCPEILSSTATLSEQVWLSKWRANSQQAG